MSRSLDQPNTVVLKWKQILALFIISMMVVGSYNFTASADTGVVNIKLSGEMPEFSSVSQDHYAFSPDGSRVVFMADRDIDQMFELYSVPITGGELVELNPALVNGGNVMQFQISADSQWVVYWADQEINDKFELYTVPIDGGDEAVKLNDDILSNQDVHQYFEIAANSEKVIYLVETDGGSKNLYSIDIGDGDPVQLNAVLGAGESVLDAKIAPSGATPETQRVVYRLRKGITTGHVELWSVQMNGLLRFELSDPAMIANGGVAGDYQITPNSAGVVYIADRYTDGVDELFSVYMDGTNRNRLNPDLTDGGDVYSFEITPNSLGVVYRADKDTNDKIELYSVATTGGTSNRLTDPAMIADGDVSDFQVTPNSGGVVYIVDMYTDGVNELFSIDVYGTSLNRLHPPLTGGHNVNSFKITPNSLGVVFKGRLNDDGYSQLYSVDIAGGEDPTQLTEINNSLILLGKFEITPNSLGVGYLADLETDEVFDLNSVPTVGGATQKWNAPNQSPSLCVGNFMLLPDSKSLIYHTGSVYSKVELYYATLGVQVVLPVVLR